MNKTSPLTKLYKSKLFLVILSLRASFAIWTYVTSGESSEIRQVFRNVRVEIVGRTRCANPATLSLRILTATV